MTIVIDSDQTSVQRVEQNLYKLVNVLRVDDVTEIPSVIRDLALIKMRADADTRLEILQIVAVFRARVVDATAATLILEVTGGEAKIEALVDVLRPFGILEMVRTGSVAMARGEPLLKEEEQSAEELEVPPPEEDSSAHSV